ncbi:hypothetical protein BDQ17DRAFT_1330306 [Cyathus striatus]|nr:hypothetical protein BDQ17DRAFT_1330306 [Cyathus striatus]
MPVNYASPARYNEPVDEKRSIVDMGLEISSLVLTTLQDAAQFAPVPYLQDAASLALSILNMVATGLPSSSKRRLRTRMRSRQSREGSAGKGGIDEESDLMRNVRQLIDTLTSIDNFTRKEAKRNVVSRFLLHQSDLDKIDEYRRRLQKSLDIFGLQSNISISDNLSRVVKQQNEIMSQKALSRPVDQSYDNAKDKELTRPSGHPAHTQPGTPPDPFTQFGTSFANFNPMSTNSDIKFTAVSGNLSDTNNSSNVTNTNSGNNTTTTISDAYNDNSYRNYGGGLGARGSRGVRRNINHH